jgi:hypothetical protein
MPLALSCRRGVKGIIAETGAPNTLAVFRFPSAKGFDLPRALVGSGSGGGAVQHRDVEILDGTIGSKGSLCNRVQDVVS